MVEIAFILYLLILFIFPGPVIVGTLGIWTTWFLYEKYNLFSQQPSEGKKILYLNGLTYLVNLGLSLAAGFFLAFSVHVFIFDYIYLFAFNFFFSTLLALRWFDFTQPVYRRMLEKWIPSPASGPG
ncbi:MAG: hypothetical protein GWM98_24805, partial [Nitrospinaceae bacterium]|nr:hypothetical protein [Nitrospinaceae bacterium]NIR57096.1 hypothetical protein [Nitrospinaceae bacterium]NIS87537.1 hypothetical protein [Nitrospinaceae bacterium]NIT84407.1 hypothetical protein [Nitrospinaceae bacterium]NIU46594.1 hypothetical protein [Nitrospinaceae bacterium]